MHLIYLCFIILLFITCYFIIAPGQLIFIMDQVSNKIYMVADFRRPLKSTYHRQTKLYFPNQFFILVRTKFSSFLSKEYNITLYFSHNVTWKNKEIIGSFYNAIVERSYKRSFMDIMMFQPTSSRRCKQVTC